MTLDDLLRIALELPPWLVALLVPRDRWRRCPPPGPVAANDVRTRRQAPGVKDEKRFRSVFVRGVYALGLLALVTVVYMDMQGQMKLALGFAGVQFAALALILSIGVVVQRSAGEERREEREAEMLRLLRSIDSRLASISEERPAEAEIPKRKLQPMPEQHEREAS